MSKSWTRNGTFVIGIIIILIAMLLAMGAYLFIPDKTKNANDQIPELALKAPGTKVLLFKKPISNFNNKEETQFQHIPIERWEVRNESLILVRKSGYETIVPLSELLNESSNAESKIKRSYIEKRTFYFGTDKFGRDIFSRLILGLRISLLVGFVAVIISIFIGLLIGLISGYFGGFIDQVVLFIINTFWSIPTILLVFAIVVGFGRNIFVIFIAVGLTMWVDVARIVRGQVIAQKEQLFVKAAKSTGMNHVSIILKQILPNILSPVFVIAAANFSIAILIEAGLSYLGFGVQPPIPSLGNLLNENYGFALSGKIYMAIIPAIAIMLLVLAFNLAGNGLRDIFDIKDK